MKGAGEYVEYRTDDARLTIEVIKEAWQHGALAANYVKAEDFIYKKGQVAGVEASDVITGKKMKLYAKKKSSMPPGHGLMSYGKPTIRAKERKFI